MRQPFAQFIVPLGLIVCIAASPLCAQTTVDAKVSEVSMFKNGLGFVVREFTVPGEGEYLLQDLPVPAHGSFWILSLQEGSAVKEAVAISSPRSENAEALTLMELVRANVGKRVEVRTEADGWTAGTVLAAPERAPKLPIRANTGDSRYSYYDYYGSSRAYRPPSANADTKASDYILLRTEKGVLALPPSEIKGVRGAGTELATSIAQKMPGAALRMRVSGGGGRFQVAYLEWGLTWAPSYRIDISDPQRAALACRADVIDDTEELVGAKANFVTGYPNLAYAEATSPLSMIGDVSDFIQSLISLGQRRASAPAMMNVTMQQAAGPAGPGGLRGPGALGAEGLPGEVREDLFLYPLAGVNLRPGERGYYQLFARQIPYDDVYEWQVPDSLDDQGRWMYYSSYWSGYGNSRDQQPEQEEVWHSLRLTNSGDTPWTTGPAMTVQKGSILGQDTLYYTSPGQKSSLKITRSMDVKAEKQEKEVDRQRNAVTVYDGTNWDLVTVQGELRVRNYKAKPVTMVVKKTLSGEVLQSTPKAEIVTSTEGVWRLNQKQLVTWEVKVEPNGRASLTYRYRVYARR